MNSFVDSFVEYSSAITDAPVNYYRACAYFALSATINGRVKMRMSWGDVKTSLWVLLLGRSTVDRKTTCIENITTPVLTDNPANEDRIVPTDMTPEAVVDVMASRNPSRGYLVRDEFSGLLGTIGGKGYMEGMYEILMKLYDGDENYSRKIRGVVTPFVLRSMYFSILSGTTYQRLDETAGKTEVLSGFLPRFLVVTHHGDRSSGGQIERTSEDDRRQRALQDSLLDLDRFLRTSEVTMRFSEGASARYFSWMRGREKEIAESGDDIAGVVFGRAATHVLKIAMLDEISRSPSGEFRTTVPVETIDSSIRFVESIEKRTCDIYRSISADTFFKQKGHILSMIEKTGARGIPRHELLSNSRVKRTTVDEIILSLLEEFKIQETGSADSESIYIAQTK